MIETFATFLTLVGRLPVVCFLVFLNGVRYQAVHMLTGSNTSGLMTNK